MNIIVVGNGKVGSLLVEQLSQEGHDVVSIDIREDRLTDIQNSLDVLCICGNGVSRDVLLEAGVDDADLLLAVTAGDELNLLCCLVAKKLGTRHTIARVRNPELADELVLFRKDMGLSMAINPEYSAAQEIFSVLRFPGLMSIEEFGHGKFELAEFKVTKESPITSMPLRRFSSKYNSKSLVCAIRRDGETIIPSGEAQIQVNDKISFAAEPGEAERFLHLAGVQSQMPRSVMILGAGRITYYLVRMMLKVGMRPVVIESDEKKSMEFNRAFPNVLTIHADGSDRSMLEEEGIESADAFVSLTGTDEVNVLVSMYASSQNVPKVVTKVSRLSVLELLQHENIGSTVSPRDIVASRVISYVRALEKAEACNVETVYRVVENSVEALEFIARTRDDALIGIPLKNLQLKPNLLICALIRRGQVIIPRGDDCIQKDDHVIIVTTIKHLNDLKNILDNR